LACLFPIILFYAIEYKNKKKNYLFLFSFIVSSFLVGTKVPFLGILISLVCAGLFYFLKYIFTKNKKNIFVLTVPIIFIASLMIIILPYTPVGKNLNLHFKLVNVKEFSDFFDDDSDDDAMNVIYSSRNIFLENTKRNFYNAPLYRRFFGIGFVEEYSKEDQHYKAIEMDFHDIFFRFGFFGFLIYFSFVIFVCFKIFFKFLKNIKKQILNFKYILFLISILLILGIAFIAGHVFSAPAVSIYLVFFLNCLNAMFWEESFNEECLD